MNNHISQIKKQFSRNVINVFGKSIVEKIVVIESDDWGTIRMSSKEAFNELKNKGYNVDKSPYNKFDSLESKEDLEQLFDVLKSVKGEDGKPAKFTINNIVANPKFDLIEKSNFKSYFYEPFTETLKNYYHDNKVMELYFQGIDSQLIKPQFHGKEHLNVGRWMKGLQENNKALHDAFKLKIFSPCLANKNGYLNEYMDALDYDNDNEIETQKEILKKGLDLFEKIWGFKSRSFIAPCYIWDKKLEDFLSTQGIEYFQGMVNQFNPINEIGFKYNKLYHFQGQKNHNNQLYLLRNVFFEPTITPNFDWNNDCLNRIEIAFKWKKPAIISTHRLNFTGTLNQPNRTENLKKLKSLLQAIVKKWPEVRFVSSDELGDILKNN